MFLVAAILVADSFPVNVARLRPVAQIIPTVLVHGHIGTLTITQTGWRCFRTGGVTAIATCWIAIRCFAIIRACTITVVGPIVWTLRNPRRVPLDARGRVTEQPDRTNREHNEDDNDEQHDGEGVTSGDDASHFAANVRWKQVAKEEEYSFGLEYT